MAKHRRIWNREVHKQYLREGRGCGSNADYSPWIHIQDFASQGIVSRIKGRTTGRVHHLMSNKERAYFYLQDWSDRVYDIREQFPLLDLNCAKHIAAQAGIKYPTDNVSGYPYILTCDFMLTTATGLKARTVKMSSELRKPRVLEKLEIERRYWLTKGIDWKIVTEYDIPYQKAMNIEWLYSAENCMSSVIAQNVDRSALAAMLQMLESQNVSIINATQIIEREFLLAHGTGLLLFKYLVLNKEVELDLSVRLNLNKGISVAV